jgi:hypothetical protein
MTFWGLRFDGMESRGMEWKLGVEIRWLSHILHV